jgi:hypothetical protein
MAVPAMATGQNSVKEPPNRHSRLKLRKSEENPKTRANEARKTTLSLSEENFQDDGFDLFKPDP